LDSHSVSVPAVSVVLFHKSVRRSMIRSKLQLAEEVDFA